MTRPSRAETATLRVRVQPRASRSDIVGWRQPGVLAVRVTAPPVEGEANRAVATLLAGALGIAASAVRVVRGERGRDKLVEVRGLTDVEVAARLAGRVEGTR